MEKHTAVPQYTNPLTWPKLAAALIISVHPKYSGKNLCWPDKPQQITSWWTKRYFLFLWFSKSHLCLHCLFHSSGSLTWVYTICLKEQSDMGLHCWSHGAVWSATRGLQSLSHGAVWSGFAMYVSWSSLIWICIVLYCCFTSTVNI